MIDVSGSKVVARAIQKNSHRNLNSVMLNREPLHVFVQRNNGMGTTFNGVNTYLGCLGRQNLRVRNAY